MASKISINLDTSKENFLVAKCKQNDDLTLEAYIYENGAELNLTNKEIIIQALKSDNTYIIQNTDIVKENNKILAELDRDFSKAQGTTKIEIVLVESGKQNTTFSFYLEVSASVINGAVESSNTVTILEALNNKIIETGQVLAEAIQVKEDTEQLIESGGAATTGDIANITAQLEEIATNVKTFGAKGDGITDDTLAIENALKYSKNIYFPKGRYIIQPQNNTRASLYWFTDESDIKISGDNAVLVDKTIYSTSTMCNIFAFTRCKRISIKGVFYEGLPVFNPTNDLHTLGNTFAYFEDNCNDIEIDVNLKNIRYGVRSGDYLRPEFGYCQNFKIKVIGEMIGYPIALYLADNVTSYISVNGTHRATYLAGVWNANIETYCKNSYGTSIQCLMTNTITKYAETQAEQEGRGCKNINIKAVDMGSSIYLPYTSLVGIGLQWVCKGTDFENINVNFSVTSSNTIASQIAGFQLESVAKTTQPTMYQYNWEQFISIKNLKISGIINRTGQTNATNQAGEIYIRAYDTDDTALEHCPKISNLVIDNLIINKGSIQSRALYIDVPNLQDNVVINNLQADGVDLITSLKTGRISLQNSKIKSIGSPFTINELQINNSNVTSMDTSRITTISSNSIETALSKNINGVRNIKVITQQGINTYTVSSALKSTCITKAIVGVLSGFIASGNIKLGISSNLTLYANAPLNNTNGYTRISPYYFTQTTFPLYTNQPLIITLETTTTIPSGLVIDLFVYEEEFIVK